MGLYLPCDDLFFLSFRSIQFPCTTFFGLFAELSPKLWNGPSLIDILFSIYKGFTFTTKKMIPFTFKNASAPPKLPNLKADAESTRIAVQCFGSPTHVQQLRRRWAVKIRVPVSCIPFCLA